MQPFLIRMAVVVLQVIMMIAMEVSKIEWLAILWHVKRVSMVKMMVATIALTLMRRQLAEFENVMMDMWTLMTQTM